MAIPKSVIIATLFHKRQHGICVAFFAYYCRARQKSSAKNPHVQLTTTFTCKFSDKHTYICTYIHANNPPTSRASFTVELC